jgi:hypothetical protein
MLALALWACCGRARGAGHAAARLQVKAPTGNWAALDADRVTLALSAFRRTDVECVSAEWDGPPTLVVRPVITATWVVSAPFPWTIALPATNHRASLLAQGALTLTVTRASTAARSGDTCRLAPQRNESFCVDDGEACACVPGYFLDASALACAPCPPGTFKAAVGNAAACDACPAGWSSLEGRPRCFPCPVGTWGNATGACVACGLYTVVRAEEEGRATPCECAPGAYPSYHDANACALCAPGTASASGAGCHMCLPGTAAPESGQTACDRCAYQPSAGATACALCAPAWTVPDATGTRCVCAPGASLDVSGAACVPCPAHTYKSERMCAVCPPWQTTAPDAVGATACDWCAPGATRRDGETACRPLSPIVPCPAGTYVRMDGAGCEACPVHMTTYVVNAPGCACAPDIALTEAGRCVPCGPGTWGAVYGACAPCPAGTFRGDVGRSLHCADCAAGTYASAPGASACDACAAGAYLIFELTAEIETSHIYWPHRPPSK